MRLTARSCAAIAVLAVSLSLVPQASTQAQTPLIYCPPAWVNCFGLKYELVPYAHPDAPWVTNRFSFWLQNLQGSYWKSGPDPDHFWLFQLARNNPERTEKYLGIRWHDNPIGTPEGNVIEGNEKDLWLDGCADESCSQITWQWISTTGFFGCSLFADGITHGLFSYRTCPRDGVDGWVRWDTYLGFQGTSPQLPTEVTLGDFRFTASIGGFFNFDGACQFGGDNANLGGPAITCDHNPYALVPEPSAVLLLGSALGGLGFGIAIRRRRGRS